MDQNTASDWEHVRRIVGDWLDSNSLSMRDLARMAQLTPSSLSRFLSGKSTLSLGSALRVYDAMHQTLPHSDKRTLLEVSGLLPFAITLSLDPTITTEQDMHPTSLLQKQQTALRLMATGYDMKPRQDYAKRCFQAAERLFGNGSSQAAFAALLAVGTDLHMGEYEQARRELERIQQTYDPIMDPQTRGFLYSKWGWYYYDVRNLIAAERDFQKALRISEQVGDKLDIADLQHLLGLIYLTHGQEAKAPAKVDHYLRRAEQQFDLCYRNPERSRDPGNQAFDLLRKSEVLLEQGRWRDAEKLRRRARQLFGSHPAHSFVDIIEARLAGEQGQTRQSRCLAEETLVAWAQNKYTEGAAEALQILGNLELAEARPEAALERYVAALCISPFRSLSPTEQLRADIRHLCSQLDLEGTSDCRKVQHLLRDLAQERRGSFQWLSAMEGDPDKVVKQVLHWVESSYLTL